MINFKEIFTAWKTMVNPTEFQSKVAKDRLDVCIKCQYRKDVFQNKEWSSICGQCGCPLKAKIFSQEISPCPMNYWQIPDNKNGINFKQKETDTFL